MVPRVILVVFEHNSTCIKQVTKRKTEYGVKINLETNRCAERTMTDLHGPPGRWTLAVTSLIAAFGRSGREMVDYDHSIYRENSNLHTYLLGITYPYPLTHLSVPIHLPQTLFPHHNFNLSPKMLTFWLKPKMLLRP